MTPILLIDTLVDEITRLLEIYRLPDCRNTKGRTPLVVAGCLLTQEEAQIKCLNLDDLPHVIIQAIGGSVEEGIALTDIHIYCVSYNEEGNLAWYTAMNLMQRIWQHLLKNSVLAMKFRLERKIKWSIDVEKKWPQCVVMMETQWVQALPKPEPQSLFY